MKYFFSKKVVNIFLRGVTLVLKFLLSLLVIKKLSIEDYGVYGLFQSSVIILIFVVGFEFYSFSSREMLNNSSKKFSYYFKNQLFFYLMVYLIILPLSYVLFLFSGIDFEYINLFYVILISEHLSQEIYRVLIILKKTIPATILLFIRSGFWIILLYFYWELGFVEPNINTLFVLWLLGTSFSIFFGFRFIPFKWVKGVDFYWIRRGLKIAFPFFIGAVLYKLIEFSARYFLEYYFSTKEVGIFTFFSGIGNILFIFVQTIVFIELGPRLIEIKNESHDKFLKLLREFKKQTIQYSIAGIVLSSIFIYPLLVFLDKAIFFENILSYFIILASTMFYCFSYISHYALFSYNRDWEILMATVSGFVFNIVASFILIPKFGILGAAVSQLIGFSMVFIGKSIYWSKYKSKL